MLSSTTAQQAPGPFQNANNLQADPVDADLRDLMHSFLRKADREQLCDTGRQSLFARSSLCLQLAVNSTEAAKQNHLPRDRDGLIVSSFTPRILPSANCNRKFHNTGQVPRKKVNEAVNLEEKAETLS